MTAGVAMKMGVKRQRYMDSERPARRRTCKLGKEIHRKHVGLGEMVNARELGRQRELLKHAVASKTAA